MVLTLVELSGLLIVLSGLLIVIFVGLHALTGLGPAGADFSRVVLFEARADKGYFLAVTAATSLAFFAMVGYEDSVNMAEETEDPVRIFPRMMISGLLITGLIYVLVSISSVALVPIGELGEGDTPSLKVVQAGAPGLPLDEIFPFIAMCAVANSALINMLMT